MLEGIAKDAGLATEQDAAKNIAGDEDKLLAELQAWRAESAPLFALCSAIAGVLADGVKITVTVDRKVE